MPKNDLLNYLQEIRGTNVVGEEALPEDANGIYHDLVRKNTEDDGTTARLGSGVYGSIKAMYSKFDLIKSEIEDFEAILNGADTVIDGFDEFRTELDTKLKDSDLGTTVQAYSADTVIDGSYVHTDSNYTADEKAKLSGIDESANAYVITSDINDVTTSATKVYSSAKTQTLYDTQSQAIANLATAQAVIVNDDETTLDTTQKVISFAVDTDTTDSNVFTLDAAADTMTFLHNASYNFFSILEIHSSTNSAITITFKLVDTSNNAVLTTQQATLNIDNGNTTSVPLATLLTIGKDGVPVAPRTIRIEAVASGTGFTLNSFRSMLASSSSYDLTTEASGISVVPSGNLESTTAQAAFYEIQTEIDGIETNVTTDLSYNSGTRVLSSSDGADATLPLAVANGNAGLLSGSDKAKIDTIDTLFNRDLGGII